MKKYRIAGKMIDVGHPDKMLFKNIDKATMIDYYVNIAPLMLPLIKNRMFTMQRFPHGITKEGFFQKDLDAYMPTWIKRVPIKKQTGGTVNYGICNNAATLAYLAAHDVVTLHIMGARYPKIYNPDRMVFDLDPGKKITFADIITIAHELKELLETYGLVGYPMLTGSRGMHVIVPLKPLKDFDDVRACARFMAEIIAEKHPKMVTIEQRKDKRTGRLFIDILRNGFGATAVAPYSLRAHPHAPIATPISWKELDERGITSQKYTLKNEDIRYLLRRTDPWTKINADKGTLTKCIKEMEKQ